MNAIKKWFKPTSILRYPYILKNLVVQEIL